MRTSFQCLTSIVLLTLIFFIFGCSSSKFQLREPTSGTIISWDVEKDKLQQFQDAYAKELHAQQLCGKGELSQEACLRMHDSFKTIVQAMSGPNPTGNSEQIIDKNISIIQRTYDQNVPSTLKDKISIWREGNVVYISSSHWWETLVIYHGDENRDDYNAYIPNVGGTFTLPSKLVDSGYKYFNFVDSSGRWLRIPSDSVQEGKGIKVTRLHNKGTFEIVD